MLPDDVAATLDLIGLRPVVVDDLGREAWIVTPCDILLIDSQVSPDRLPGLASEVLALAAGTLHQRA